VGLDVHSKRSVFVIEAADGRVVARGDIPTTPAGFRRLREQHALAAATPVALETGTVTFYAARELARGGLRPVVIDAHEVRLKAHRPRQKSDRRDALELCEGLRRDQYRAIVHVPPAPIGALRETLSRRRHFVAVRVAEVNAVKRLLRAAGLGPLSTSLRTTAGWERLLAALVAEPVLHTSVTQHYTLWRCAQDQIAALEATLGAPPAAIAETAARLQTVPGVGPIVALTTVAVVSQAHRRREVSSPPHSRMRVSRAPPRFELGCHTRTDQAQTLPRSSLTVRLHGRTFAEFSPAPSQVTSSRTPRTLPGDRTRIEGHAAAAGRHARRAEGTLRFR
jgi:transposase